jgi:hypothetical protein
MDFPLFLTKRNPLSGLASAALSSKPEMAGAGRPQPANQTGEQDN